VWHETNKVIGSTPLRGHWCNSGGAYAYHISFNKDKEVNTNTKLSGMDQVKLKHYLTIFYYS